MIEIPALAAMAVIAAQGAPVDPRAKAFEAKTVAEAQSLLGVQAPEATKRLRLEAPDIVDGAGAKAARVTVKLTSAIPGTDWIAIFVERGAKPLVAFTDYPPGVDHVLVAQVDLPQTATVRVVIRAAGKYYQMSREIKVARKGCTSP